MKKFLLIGLVVAFVVAGVAGVWAGPVSAGSVGYGEVVGNPPGVTFNKDAVTPVAAGLRYSAGAASLTGPGTFCFGVPNTADSVPYLNQYVFKYQDAAGVWRTLPTTGAADPWGRCATFPGGTNTYFLGY